MEKVDSAFNGSGETIIGLAVVSHGMLEGLRRLFTLLIAGVYIFSVPCTAQAPATACDLTGDGVVDAADVTLAVNMALGLSPCMANLVGNGVCNIVMVQRVVNATLTGTCVAGFSHAVTLNWAASTSASVVGFNVYRSSTSGGPYAKLNDYTASTASYVDQSVQSGQTYYYVATAVDVAGNESVFSAEVRAAIPSP